LLRKYIKTKRFNIKLDFKKLRLFRIIKVIKPVNYRLQLSEKSRLHFVFYISLLEPAKEDTSVVINIDIQPENEIQKYKVEKILDMRTSIKGQQKYFIIKKPRICKNL